MKDRYLTTEITADLKDRKMVFVGGPRQVGKNNAGKRAGRSNI